jgi:hypothetical protein
LQDVLVMVTTKPEPRAQRRPAMISLVWQGDSVDGVHWLLDILACREKFPDAYLDQARPCGGADSGIEKALTTDDPADRAALYKSIENALFGPGGEMPVIPIYVNARALAIGAKLEVYPVHAGPLRFDQWVMGE